MVNLYKQYKYTTFIDKKNDNAKLSATYHLLYIQ